MKKKPLTGRDLLLMMRLAEAQALPIPQSAKDRIASIVQANSDPKQGEGLDFALKHLPKERLAIVTESAKRMHSIGRSVARRGRASLQALSDAEWEKLVEDAQKANDE